VTARMHSTTEVCRRERCRRKRSNVDNASSGVASSEGSYRWECCVTRFLFSRACNNLVMLLCRLSSSLVTIDAFVPWDEAHRSDDKERASGSSSSHSMASSSSSSLGFSCGEAMASASAIAGPCARIALCLSVSGNAEGGVAFDGCATGCWFGLCSGGTLLIRSIEAVKLR
jgi:hypothetical protein